MNKHDREKMVRRMYRRFKGTHLANPLVSWFVQDEVDRAVRAERKSQRDTEELDKVRADITRTAVVVQAMAAALNLYGEERPPKNETDALSEQENKLRDLLVRDRRR